MLKGITRVPVARGRFSGSFEPRLARLQFNYGTRLFPLSALPRLVYRCLPRMPR